MSAKTRGSHEIYISIYLRYYIAAIPLILVTYACEGGEGKKCHQILSQAGSKDLREQKRRDGDERKRRKVNTKMLRV